MPRNATITRERLMTLGPEALAEIVLAQCGQDRAFAKQVRLQLADGAGGSALLQEIDRRLGALARSRRFVDWRESGALAQDLEQLRVAIAERLAPAEPAACDRLQRFLALGGPTMERMDDSDGVAADVFRSAVADLGRIWAGRADRDPGMVARLVVDLIETNDHGLHDGAVGAFAEALGEAGRATLRRELQARLAALPTPAPDDHRLRFDRITYVLALEHLADAEHDVDAFIAASAAEPGYDAKRVDVAQRLLAAGRAEEALAWLEPCGGYDEARLVDLRLAALEALGRKDEAQALRWAWFERSLSAAHARDFVRRLPDFDGFEAERRAVRTALGHANPHAALLFLLEFPDLSAADELVRRDIQRLNPRACQLFNTAAERLAERHPVAATLLWRRKVEDVLERASSNQYGYAVRDVQQAAAHARQLPMAEVEGHEAWMARLKQEHGRKWRFWELVERSR